MSHHASWPAAVSRVWPWVTPSATLLASSGTARVRGDPSPAHPRGTGLALDGRHRRWHSASSVSSTNTARSEQDGPAFALGYDADPARGYGYGMHQLLPRLLQEPDRWAELARELFDDEGSLGNGAAMRVAPLGAWFRHDLRLVIAQATLSAEVTHAHPEGIAGAVAVAVAAAFDSLGPHHRHGRRGHAGQRRPRGAAARREPSPSPPNPGRPPRTSSATAALRRRRHRSLRRLVRRPPPRRPGLGPVEHGGGLRRRRHDLRHRGRHRGRPYGSGERTRGMAEPPRGGPRRRIGRAGHRVSCSSSRRTGRAGSGPVRPR